MRSREEVLISASNPATGQFRGRYKGESFVPGKGLHQKDNELMA